MQIFVKSLENTLTFDVDPSTSIEGLKQLVEEAEFVPCEAQRLVCNSQQVESGSLAECGITNGMTVTVLLDVVGGAHKNNPWKKSSAKFRWKWKKKRTRRLMKKRRKMRQRAR
jgi:hypothetical protein